MPEDIEVETNDLQEAIDELHHEREERVEAERETRWTRYVGLATAIFAVFAALGALQSGSLVNEAMIQQLKSSDTWNEYQADRTKVHMYELQENQLIDLGARAPKSFVPSKHTNRKLSPDERLATYQSFAEEEDKKTTKLASEGKRLAEESTELMHHHHRFAYSVTAIQVAIALGAVSALTKMKWVWAASLVFGAVGLVYFAQGFF